VTDTTTFWSAEAPGKVVLAGEYAVLAGAPSLVMAIDRLARCTITANSDDHWTFSSSGFEAESQHRLNALADPAKMAANDPARLLGWALTGWQKKPTTDWLAQLPRGALVHTDTTEMYEGNLKLGLGSSAALMTAISGCLTAMVSAERPAFQAIHQAHQSSQGGIGSGLDVATSLTGGLIRFEAGTTTPGQWPNTLHYRFVYSGKPASTSKLVGRFNRYRETAQKSHSIEPLKTLIDASATLANGAINLDNLARYVCALKALDDAAEIGIYSAEHTSIAAEAERHQLIYKPCGAGGGDLGVAIGERVGDLENFTDALDKNFAVIDLEIAAHGLKIG